MFSETSIALVFAIRGRRCRPSTRSPSSPASADLCYARSPTGAVGWGRGGSDFAPRSRARRNAPFAPQPTLTAGFRDCRY